MSLTIVPIDFDEACIFVGRFHRHHKPPLGHKFSLAVALDRNIVGVAIVGRPVSRHLDNGWTLEVTRLCTDGTDNACSKLYRAAWRVTHGMGYRKLVTYTLGTEGGASLRGAGFKCLGAAGGGSWNGPERIRIDKHPTQEKIKWELAL